MGIAGVIYIHGNPEIIRVSRVLYTVDLVGMLVGINKINKH